MHTNTVVFAPKNKQQVRALLQYIEGNRSAIDKRKTGEYKQAVKRVRVLMREYFRIHPAKSFVKECPWTITGATKMCADIAETFKVPYWDIVAEANPALNKN